MSELSNLIEASFSFAEPSLKEMEEGKPWYYSRKGQANLLFSLMAVDRAIQKGLPYIRSVAIKDLDSDAVHSLPRPARHHDVIKWMRDRNVRCGKQGFINNNGNFVDRETAFKIATESGQILDLNNTRGKTLFSEDLW